MDGIDMKLEDLWAYRGTNPRPADFDAYWDRALAELDQTAAQPELVPEDYPLPFAECFHLWFTGVGGARIHAKFIRPKNRVNCPAVLLFHGYGGSSGSWQELIPFAAAGFCAAFMDCRGQGGLSQDLGGVSRRTLQGHIIRGIWDGPEHLLFRSIFLDTAQLARVMMNMEEVDASRVGAAGGSQGGGLTLACAALEPRLNRAAPHCPFLCDYRRAYDMRLGKDAYQELTDFFRMYDPAHEKEEWFFEQLGYIDVHNLASRIRCKVIMATGLMDTVCPPSTQFAAFNAIPVAEPDKQVFLYPDFLHEVVFGWLDRVYQFMLDMDR